jgi:hypothetical protein
MTRVTLCEFEGVPDTRPERWQRWHILTVGESGFSMLDIYGRLQRGLDIEVIRNFATRINEYDESGTLHPRAPISAIPRRFFRDQAQSTDPRVMQEFERHVTEFVEANRRTIKAANVLVDFHVSPASVPLRYIEATERIFRSEGPDSPVKEVVIFT